MKKLNKAAIASLAKVEICKKRIEAFEFATNGVRIFEFRGKYIKKEISDIRAYLAQELSEAYRELFMWGVVNPEATIEAKYIAYHTFLKEKVNLDLLEKDPRNNSSYNTKILGELKREINEIMGSLTRLTPKQIENLKRFRNIEFPEKTEE